MLMVSSGSAEQLLECPVVSQNSLLPEKSAVCNSNYRVISQNPRYPVNLSCVGLSSCRTRRSRVRRQLW